MPISYTLRVAATKNRIINLLFIKFLLYHSLMVNSFLIKFTKWRKKPFIKVSATLFAVTSIIY